VKDKMTNDQVKEILMLYRPGTADAEDPSFAEALEVCKHDAELRKWFAEHCALYAALRTKFKQISAPEGLKEQIIAERKVNVTPGWQRAVIVAGMAALVFLAALGVKSLWPQPGEPHDFASYRGRMIGYARLGYSMDLNTTNLDQVRLFLAQSSGIADYVLPEGLEKNAKVAGCVATSWQDKKVSMICFQTGRPLPANDQSDLWLFITDNNTTKDTPKTATPHIEKANDGIVSASWTVGNRTYVLAAKGDEQLLGKFL
jgi:hypothetical protein